MRLMVLGNEQTGKTSLLQAFKRESGNSTYGQQNRRKSTSNRNFPILDISEWMYEKTPRTPLGPITFRTWDFGGQVRKENEFTQNDAIVRCCFLFSSSKNFIQSISIFLLDELFI